MLNFSACPFYHATRAMHSLQCDLRKAIGERGKESLLVEEEIKRLYEVIGYVEYECRRIHLESALDELAALTNLTGGPSSVPGQNIIDTMTLERLMVELNRVDKAISKDLLRGTFFYMPRHFANYHYDSLSVFSRRELYGKEVIEKFPRAVEEMREAGNCYATGNWTATVFHLMRALEHGLRALAGALKVPFPSKFELKTWDELIRDVEKEIQKIILRPKTPKRAKDLEFYNGAAAQFRYFKDAWRNHVMHTRTSYDRQDAAKALEHVTDFMQHIATRLKEK